jgi:hypothetical protein
MEISIHMDEQGTDTVTINSKPVSKEVAEIVLAMERAVELQMDYDAFSVEVYGETY